MSKKTIITALFLVLCTVLSACAPAVSADTEPATVIQTAAPTEKVTEAPTEPATEPQTEAVTTEASTEAPPEEENKALNYSDMKAMWLSQFDLNGVYTGTRGQRAEDDFREKLSVVLDNVVKNHYNTVIVQCRPYADSMYPSDICPPCYLVTGKYSKEFTYDPFAIIVEEAHKRDLSVQAWINPMRAMQESEIKQVSDKYRIRQWYDDAEKRKEYLPIVSGRVYLNIGYEEVRRLIIDGAVELLTRYGVDGLHMDDYFYPTTDSSFDSGAYKAYKKDGGKLALAEFRKDALSKLVSELYRVTKESGEGRIYGISPAGNINTVRSSHYADVDRWCKEDGYIDYICPQVYFGLEHQNYGFKKVCDTWSGIIKNGKVKLIIGMSLGKAKAGYDQYAGSGKNEWAEHKDVLLRCLQYTETLEKCRGVAYFCYQYFYDPVSGAEETATKKERENFVPYLESITWN